MKLKNELNITKWDENVINGFEKEIPISRVSTCFELKNISNGKFNVDYIMVYKEYDPKDPHNSKADYLGIMEFVGILDGKQGTFTVEDNGTYENSMVKSKIKIIEKTGTGELKNIAGNGNYYVENGELIIELEYTL